MRYEDEEDNNSERYFLNLEKPEMIQGGWSQRTT